MRRKTRTALVVLVILLSGYLLGLATAWAVISRPYIGLLIARLNPASIERRMPLFWEVWHIVEVDFIGQVPDSRTVTYGAIRGALATLGDPYSSFIEPRAHQREVEELQGKFGGIGVTMHRDEAGNVVLSPMVDGPAMRAGVQEGDILILVDGHPITSSVSFDEIAALVRGPVGTPVTIEVQRSDPPTAYEFTIIRQEIELPSVTWRLIEEEPDAERPADIGYIAISRFSERSKDELVHAVGELYTEGATRFILDLRGNGGGLRQAGIEVASQFLPDGVVMYQQRKDELEESYSVIRDGVAIEVPLVVLVNHGTASAAEIVAGALQDHGRAKLVGEQTFGKGSVQHIYDLSDGSSLHITTAEWLTPNHRQLTGQGLTPDITVARTPEDANAGRDPQLTAAIEALAGARVSEK